MYLRMPQGYLASGDPYTCRYDKIIKNLPRKIKIVDDTLLFDKNIEDAFYHTLDYLLLCEKNGIVLNREKFHFCQDVIEFGDLQKTSSGVTPYDKLLNAISSFPTSKKYHRCKVLVWAGQPSCICILIKPHNAAISGPRKKKTHTHTLFGMRTWKKHSSNPNRSLEPSGLPLTTVGQLT